MSEATAVETATTEAPAKLEVIPLSALDACDPCGYSEVTEDNKGITERTYASDVPSIAQAWVRATFPSGHDLLFCAHHYASHEAALLNAGATIQDERHKLNVKPSPSGTMA